MMNVCKKCGVELDINMIIAPFAGTKQMQPVKNLFSPRRKLTIFRFFPMSRKEKYSGICRLSCCLRAS